MRRPEIAQSEGRKSQSTGSHCSATRLNLMVPRGGLPRSNEIKGLQIGGTQRLPTRSLGFLPCVSHKSPAWRPGPRHDPNASQLVLVASPSFESNGDRASSERGLLFDARLEGEERVLVRRTHQPLLDASRVLRADGIDPQTRIILRRAGSHSDALISSVGGAAKLRVKEDAGQPRFRSWTPFPSARSSRPCVCRKRR